MANISKIELGDTTYNIKDAIARTETEAITTKDENGNVYVKTSKLEVNGDTTTDNTIISKNSQIVQTSLIDRDGDIPSSTIWGPTHGFKDKHNENIGYLQIYQSKTSGSIGLSLQTYNEDTDGNEVGNYLRLSVGKDGTCYYNMSDPIAFRTAINAVGASNQAAQEATIRQLNNATQHWGIEANVVSTTNNTYKNHRTGLVLANTEAFLYDFSGDPENNGAGKGTIWTAYTTLNKPTPAEIGAAPASHTHSYLPLSGGTLTGNVFMNAGSKGYYLYDSAKKNYPGIFDNGSNLWIGSTATKSTHHTGQTYISSGYNASNNKGNTTIYVSVPNASNNDGTNYAVYHTGYKPTYSDVGAAAASHTHPASDITGTLGVANGGTGIATNPSMLVNLASTTADTVLEKSPRPGVTGTLGVANGGTGITANPSMLINLASTAVDTVFKASPRPGITGTLPISHGGTGKTTAADARAALGAQAAGHYATWATNTVNNVTYNQEAYFSNPSGSVQLWNVGSKSVNEKNRFLNKRQTFIVQNHTLSLYDSTNSLWWWNAVTNSILYTSSSGSTGTITTTGVRTPEPFSHMLIIYKGNDGFQHSSLVKLTVSGSGRTGTSTGTAALFVIENTPSTTTHNTNIKWRTVTISEKPRTSSDTKDPPSREFTISTSNYGEFDNGIAGTSNHIYILQVIGLHIA